MATSADNEADVGISSDEVDRPLICKPCEEDGEELTAVGFCVNCGEYLCRKCYDVHLIPSITRKHVLKCIEKVEGSASTSESKYSCQQHGDKDIEYHCPTHSFFGCQVCFYQHQKSCKDVIFILDSAESSEQCDKFYQKLAGITRKCTKLVSKMKSNLQAITTKHMEAVTAINAFTQEIISVIDKLKNDLIEKFDKIQIEETARIRELSMKCETLLSNAQKMSVKVEIVQNKNIPRDLYIELFLSKDDVPDLEDQVKNMENNKQANMPEYKPNKELANLLKNPLSIGRLRNSVIEKLEHVRDINCKTTNDSHDCINTGSVLLPGQKLIVTDVGEGNTVKLIDLQQDKIQSDLKLSQVTWGTCKITDTSVAVTIPNDKKVTFLRIDPTLSVEREMKVNGKPRGIDYLDGLLVVSYSSHKVEIMDIQGKLMKTFTKANYGNNIVNWPGHVSIHPENKRIYISNRDSHNVVCMTMEGTVVALYTDNELTCPRQVTFDSSGMVYVCEQGSHNVHQITEDCQKVKVILTNTNGLNQPLSISYDEDKGLVYIGQHTNNKIKVYRGASSFT